jgi:hypothetical protein
VVVRRAAEVRRRGSATGRAGLDGGRAGDRWRGRQAAVLGRAGVEGGPVVGGRTAWRCGATGRGGGRRGVGRGRWGKKKVRKKMMLTWAINGLKVPFLAHLPEGR